MLIYGIQCVNHLVGQKEAKYRLQSNKKRNFQIRLIQWPDEANKIL